MYRALPLFRSPSTGGHDIMIRIRSMFRAASLAVALVALPAAAFADDAPTQSPGQPTAAKTKADKAHKKGKKGHEHDFPMKAEQFKKLVEERIAHARERLDKALDAHDVPEATRAQIKKDFDAGAAAIRAAADKVASDGQVTKEEAKDVKDLAKDLKQKAREKYGLGKRDGKNDGKKPAQKA